MNSFFGFGTVRSRRAGAAFAVSVLASVAASGCSSESGKPRQAPTGQVSSSYVGDDPATTVSAANTVLNAYARLNADVAAGATTLTIPSAAALDLAAPFGALAAGDLLMIAQMQGA